MDPGQAPRKKRLALSGKTKPRISRRALKYSVTKKAWESLKRRN